MFKDYKREMQAGDKCSEGKDPSGKGEDGHDPVIRMN